MKNKWKLYLLFQLFLMLYSLTGIISKFAGREPFLSPRFIMLYALEILVLGIYAIGWQQFLKYIPFSVANANKSVGIVWNCIWSTTVFHEHLTPGKLAGAALVLIGVTLYGLSDERTGAQ